MPTDTEPEILKIVWQRPVACTTVLTRMGIPEHEGHLTKKGQMYVNVTFVNVTFAPPSLQPWKEN